MRVHVIAADWPSFDGKLVVVLARGSAEGARGGSEAVHSAAQGIRLTTDRAVEGGAAIALPRADHVPAQGAKLANLILELAGQVVAGAGRGGTGERWLVVGNGEAGHNRFLESILCQTSGCFAPHRSVSQRRREAAGLSDRFQIELERLPDLVRALGDRARDAQSAADDARKLLSRVEGLSDGGSGASGSVSDAQRNVARAESTLFALQKDLANRSIQLARDEGYPELVQAIEDAAKPPPKHHWWDPITHAAGAVVHFVSHNPLEAVHIGLDVLGFIPVVGEVANGLNALIYLAEGDWTNAALSAVALIPIAGDAALVARMGARGVRIAEDVAVAERVVTDVSRATRDVRAIEEGAQALRAVDEGAQVVRAGEEGATAVREGSAAVRASEGADAVPVGGGHGGGGGGSGGGGGGGGDPLRRGDAGAFGDLSARGTTGDNLTAHHMPQDARHFLPREQGGAIVLIEPEHALTRTYFGKGRIVAREEADLPFNQTLQRDIDDLRRIAPNDPVIDRGIENLLQYYDDVAPHLLRGPGPSPR